MKNINLSLSISLLLILTFILTGSSQSMAKGDKKQKAIEKKWKKRAKNFKKTPLALKSKIEGYEEQIEELTEKNAELMQRYTECQADKDKLEAQVRNKDGQIASCQSEFERLKTAFAAEKTREVKDEKPGLVYRVQIGAYEKFKISDELTNTDENFAGENSDNLNKYSMGNFRDYNLARAFRDDVIKLGIKGAWVVAYNEGIRISVKEAMGKQGLPTNTVDGPAVDTGTSDRNMSTDSAGSTGVGAEGTTDSSAESTESSDSTTEGTESNNETESEGAATEGEDNKETEAEDDW